jgi:hypothetical protein
MHPIREDFGPPRDRKGGGYAVLVFLVVGAIIVTSAYPKMIFLFVGASLLYGLFAHITEQGRGVERDPPSRTRRRPPKP